MTVLDKPICEDVRAEAGKKYAWAMNTTNSNTMSFDAQRAHEHNLQCTANERSHHLRRWLSLATALLITLTLLMLLELRISGTATAAHVNPRSAPQRISAAEPASRATITAAAAEIMQPNAFESATHSAGLFPVVPHRFPDAEHGTEGATTTTGTLFIVQ
jgi:hypothetical protein